MAINTIRACWTTASTCTAWCNVCRHMVVLDLDELGGRLGFDYSTMHDALTPSSSAAPVAAETSD